jgi:hypothetical protein
MVIYEQNVSALTLLVKRVPKQMAPWLPQILPPVWQTLTQSADIYLKTVVNGTEEVDEVVDSDGELNKIKKLNPWTRVLLEKIIVTQLVKKFPSFYGTQRLFTMFTRAHKSEVVCNMLLFCRWVILSPCTHQAWGPPLVGCLQHLCSIFAATLTN